uniref:Sulfotransferase n=1 Tax=Apteryx owenii TaxID=8824 RepID=A0A8B9PAD4_APTOW
MEPSKEYLFTHKGFYFAANITTPEYLDSLETFEIRDSDVFIATYPKSGKKEIVSKGKNKTKQNNQPQKRLRIPWLEYNTKHMDYSAFPSPRLFATHLPYYLTPRDLRNKRARVSDVIFTVYLKTIMTICPSEWVQIQPLFSSRFPCLLLASSWLDHVTGWHSHAEDFNILFLTYEEMKKDLRSAVLKICNFVGKTLNAEEAMNCFPKIALTVFRQVFSKGMHSTSHLLLLPLSSGTTGDWKNMMTVAQSERVDELCFHMTEFLFPW